MLIRERVPPINYNKDALRRGIAQGMTEPTNPIRCEDFSTSQRDTKRMCEA